MKLHKSKSSSSERAGSTSIPLQEASLFKKMVTKVSDNYLTEQWERKYYADQYTCCPPPLFIPIISLIQVSIFLLYLYYPEDPSVTDSKHRRSGSHVMVLLGPVPEDSLLIYHPDKRNEIWRFFTYMFAHEGWTHLIFNLTVQLLVGLPLEMVHGSVRLGMIYLTGILAGSLATSIFDPQTILLGASGGVYALLAAHLSNVLLNYNDMELGLLKVFAVLLVGESFLS
jgi:rhomboid-related protein 1/2/3